MAKTIEFTERDLVNIRIIIGANLKAARLNAGLTQTGVMNAIYGVSNNRNRISEVETGRKKEITVTELLKFQELYGQSLDYICGLSTEPEMDMLAGSVNHVVNQSQSLVEMLTTQVANVVVSQMKVIAKDDHAALIAQTKALCNTTKRDYQNGLVGMDSLQAVNRAMHVIRNIEVKQARQAQAVESQMTQISERLSSQDGHKLIRDRDKHYQYSLPITIVSDVAGTNDNDFIDVEFMEVYNGR